MGAGRKTQTFNAHENVPWSSMSDNGSVSARNLPEADLCGAIFGCTNYTMAECLSKQLFGLPYGHISFVKKIGVGLPLFLFNYSDRKLHGIYEAVSHGKLYLNTSAWTDSDSQRCPFPAQVRIRTRTQCEALVEDQFRKVIERNYYTAQHFWFELDSAQTEGLIALFKPFHPPPSTKLPSVASREKEDFPALPSTKIVALSKKQIPRGWKDRSHNNQKIKDLKQPSDFVNENKFASLLSAQTEGLISLSNPSHPPPSTKLPPVASREKKDFPALPSTKIVALSKKEIPKGWKDHSHDNQKIKDLKQPSDFVNENKFASLLCDDGDSEHDSPTEASSSIVEDMESKGPASDWEDLAVDNVEFISSGAGASHDGADYTSKKLQCTNEAPECKEKRILHIHENLAADKSDLNSSSNDYVHHGIGTVYCSPGDVYENSGSVLHDSSVLAKKEDYLTTSYLNNETAQPVENLYASNFNGNIETLEYSNAPDLNLPNVEFVQFIKDIKEWAESVKNHQVESDREIQQLRNQKWYSARKIGLLEDRVKELELKIDPSKLVDDPLDKSVKQYLGSEDVIYLIGGFDGCSCLSSLDSFSPSLDKITPLRSMGSARSYASAVALDGNLFVFGGGNGSSWFDTVEYYNRRHDEWISCPSMLRKKVCMSGVTMNGKIFAIGGGDGRECLSDVEMFDPAIGSWHTNQSMLYKRFGFAAAELKGAIYALGGYDGKQYLRSAEKFDPREGYWTELPSMHTRRGSHALAVLNENLYCIGGHNGQKRISSIEIFDPRLNNWVMGQPMKVARGYFATAVLGNSLFAIGGVDDNEDIVDTVECYKEGAGWTSGGWKAIGKRCFFPAVML